MSTEAPICDDLYCGLGGWADGFLAEGYRVRGYDIEAHDYGTGGYPGELIIRDVRSIHGSELKDATCIVGSSPCQEFSYRAMPWKRAKALPPPYLGIELFNAQFRIQREACEAANRYIPLVVENVRGAQKWVGKARWNYGSFYLWGDVPALMPIGRSIKVPSFRFDGSGKSFQTASVDGLKVPGIKLSEVGFNVAAARRTNVGNGARFTSRDCGYERTAEDKRQHIGASRKAASAMIAKIPYPLALHIAQCFKLPSHEATTKELPTHDQNL